MIPKQAGLWAKQLGLPLDRLIELDRRYSEPHRAYHNWAHIADLLIKLDQHMGAATRPDLIALAILYHDAIYDMRGSDGKPRSDAQNVMDSAELARLRLHAILPGLSMNYVMQLILSTSGHQPRRWMRNNQLGRGYDNDVRLLLDLDLSILAAGPKAYQRYEAAITEEYAGLYSPQTFAAGRAAVLSHFQARPALFLHPVTKPLYEARARETLQRSIETWTAVAIQRVAPHTIVTPITPPITPPTPV